MQAQNAIVDMHNSTTMEVCYSVSSPLKCDVNMKIVLTDHCVLYIHQGTCLENYFKPSSYVKTFQVLCLIFNVN